MGCGRTRRSLPAILRSRSEVRGVTLTASQSGHEGKGYGGAVAPRPPGRSGLQGRTRQRLQERVEALPLLRRRRITSGSLVTLAGGVTVDAFVLESKPALGHALPAWFGPLTQTEMICLRPHRDPGCNDV